MDVRNNAGDWLFLFSCECRLKLAALCALGPVYLFLQTGTSTVDEGNAMKGLVTKLRLSTCAILVAGIAYAGLVYADAQYGSTEEECFNLCPFGTGVATSACYRGGGDGVAAISCQFDPEVSDGGNVFVLCVDPFIPAQSAGCITGS